jgi:hypothetical protein
MTTNENTVCQAVYRHKRPTTRLLMGWQSGSSGLPSKYEALSSNSRTTKEKAKVPEEFQEVRELGCGHTTEFEPRTVLFGLKQVFLHF